MNNEQISTLLRNVAAVFVIKDEKKFKFQIIAYQRAADSIENLTTQVSDLYNENRLGDIQGVGSSIQGYLEELFKNGKVKHFQNELKNVPESVFPLLQIPSFGPKKAFKLVTQFNLKNSKTVIHNIEMIAKENKIASVDGFGEKSQADILAAVTSFKQGVNKTDRMILPFASELADQIITYLKKSKDVIDAFPLGSLRRRVSTIGDIDIAVSTRNPKSVLDYFSKYPYIDKVLEKGEASSSILISGGKHIDLMVQPPERFGSLLQHFTGSKEHNVHLREVALKQGLSLSEYGIKKTSDAGPKRKPYESEEKFYNALKMDWIPPEIRENTGEIELALAHKLPKLVELSDIKSDSHLHSNYPIEPSHDMGISSMEVMIKKAISLRYKFIGFSEHNPSVSKHSREEVVAILKKRRNFIEQLNLKNTKNIRIYSLLETDILTNGDLAINDDALELLDATLVSIHSSFSMDTDTMTRRILKGLSHKKAKILSHPTGRLLNERKGYDLDWGKIFNYCSQNNKALEINASPLRLDLPDSMTKQAIEMGVKLIINTDSHNVTHMDMMRYGVDVARRGWCTKKDILNTLSVEEFDKWIKS